MKIAIDLTPLLSRATGVDTYLQQLVIHLGRLDGENEYRLFVNYEDRTRFRDVLPPNFRVVPTCFRSRLLRLGFQQVALPIAARLSDVDVVHCPSFFSPLWSLGAPRLLTVYDMSFFSLREHHNWLRASWLFRRGLLASIRRADMITVPSRSAFEDLCSIVPDRADRVTVVEGGVAEVFQPQPPEVIRGVLGRLDLPEAYVLYVGTIEPRKSLLTLVRSFRALIRDGNRPEHLVLAGALGWKYRPLLREIAGAGLEGRVHLPGYVPYEDLPALYAGARLFVYPSIFEGFGFPPLEAMACGVPTIASRSSALVENLDGAAELFAPQCEHELLAAMRHLLGDDALRIARGRAGRRRVARFRWEETARKTLECYARLADLRE